jgi:pilus assembly protein CpaB
MKKIVSGSGLLVIATLLGVVTAAAAFAWLAREDTAQTELAAAVENTRPGVVAAANIPAGVRLTADLVEVREIPDAAYLTGTTSDAEAVIGRVTRYPLVQGEQVGSSKLVTEGEAGGTGLAFAVPPGMRAVSVSISEVRGAGGLIVPGDRVDVMVHTEYERLFGPTDLQTVDRDEQRHPTVVTVLQDVLVLAVAQQTTPPIDGQRDTATLRPEDAPIQPQAGSVTLAVTSQQAQSLFFSAQEGTIGLALRSFGDNNAISVEPLLRLEPLVPPGSGLTSGN